MRIHWAVVVFSVIGTILITWHLRTKDMDFLTPEGVEITPEEGSAEIAALQPQIVDQPKIDGEVIAGVDQQKNKEPEVPQITDQDLGDLEASPGLTTFREFANSHSPDRLFELSSALRARGQFQRALLAFERVIDTGKADSDALAEAAKGIAALSPTLPRWNIDPSSEIILTLHLGTSGPASDPLKQAILDVALLIQESSGDQLEIVPTINSTNQTDAPENRPILLWLAPPGEDSLTSSVITLRLPEDETSLTPEISLAVFRAIRSHLTRLGYPAAPDVPTPGPNLLKYQITRLMWRDFARSLQKKEAEPEDPADPANPN